MKKLIFLCLITSAQTLFSQTTEWQKTFMTGIYREGGAQILLDEGQTVRAFCANTLFSRGHYGEPFDKTYPPSIQANRQIIYAAKFGDGLFAMTKPSFGANTDNYTPTLIYSGSSPLAFDPIEDDLSTLRAKTPPCLQVADSSFIMFGNSHFTKITLNNDATYDIDWKKTNNNGQATDVAKESNNYMVTTLFAPGQSYLRRISPNGDGLFTQPFSADLYSVDTKTNAYVIAGGGLNGAFVSKFQSDGTMLWQKDFPDDSIAFEVIALTTGGYAFTGTTKQEEMVVVRLSESGNILWRKVFEHAEVGYALLQRPYGGLWAAGRVSTPSAIVLSLDENGNTGSELDDGVRLEANQLGCTAGIEQASSLGTIQYPRDSSTNVLYSGQVWAGAVDDGGNLQVMAEGYTFENDRFPGYVGGNVYFFERTWSLSRADIEAFRSDFSDGQLDMPVNSYILNWPAKGNPHLLQYGLPVDIDRDLAPFKDENRDGKYDPLDGDYPLIKGDQMLWWVMNDTFGVHSNSNGAPLGIDIIGSLYAYNCGMADELHQRTAFLELTVTNRSGEPKQDFRLGMMNDFDLGCYEDDFIGSIEAQNAAFVYNQDTVDGQPGNYCDQTSVFLDEIPAFSASLLNAPARSIMYYNNPGVGQPYPGTTDPDQASEFYRYLDGKWKDGTPFTAGGSGYQSGGAPTQFAFNGSPDNQSAWSECSAGLPPGDRRTLINYANNTLLPNESITLRYAYSAHLGVALPCPSTTGVISDLESIHEVSDQFWLDLSGREIWPMDTLFAPSFPNLLSIPAGGSYLWSNGNIQNTITVFEEGWYGVEAISPFGCTYSDSVYVTGTVSTQHPSQEENRLTLFPNPTSQILHLRLDTPVQGLIRLFDFTGRPVFSDTFNGQTATLDTNILPEGIYLAVFEGRNGTVLRSRFVKN